MAKANEYREVAITGIGIISSLGVGKQAHKEAFRRGDSGARLMTPEELVSPFARSQESYDRLETKIAAPLHISFNPTNDFSRIERNQMHKSIMAGEMAVREALGDPPHLVAISPAIMD